MKKFDSDLALLTSRIQEMSELARTMVELAARTVKDRRSDVYDEIAASEAKLDAMQMDIDHDAIRMLIVYGPVAADLRFLLVVTHVTSQLERMGDQVINVCESLNLMQTDLDHRTMPDLHKLAEMTCQMVENALNSFFERDAERAITTRSQDDQVDALEAQIVKTCLSEDVLREADNTHDLADSLAQILIARNLERIADQAVNICKEVIYMVRGDDVRHLQKSVG